MKALLLTGGFGTRLRPLTYTRPKHLLPIANRPHMEHVFELLSRHGITEVVLTTSYLADAFATTISNARGRGLSVEVAHEPAPLGTAGAIRNAEPYLGGETFLVFNGDILTDADLTWVIGWHRMRGAEATILLTPVDDPSAYGVVPTDDTGRVLGFIEKPPPGEAPTNLINAGVYVFEPSVLQRIPRETAWSAERQLFPGLVAEGAGLFAVGTEAYWIDIGTPQKYLQANLDALSGRYEGVGGHGASGSGPQGAEDGQAVLGAVAPRGLGEQWAGNGMVLADAGASIAPDARVRTACLGAGAAVEGGATVESSVLLPAAVVGSGATVLRSILGEGARVAPGARVEDRAVADNQEVAEEES